MNPNQGRESAHVRLQPDPYLQLSHNLKDDNASVKWCPFTVGVVSTNLSKDGIVPGDGLKGYLDTDLFRCARVAQGQTFSNGSFYHKRAESPRSLDCG